MLVSTWFRDRSSPGDPMGQSGPLPATNFWRSQRKSGGDISREKKLETRAKNKGQGRRSNKERHRKGYKGVVDRVVQSNHPLVILVLVPQAVAPCFFPFCGLCGSTSHRMERQHLP